MAIPLVQVRHKTTGAKTFLPETSLRHFPDYVKTPSQVSREEVPDPAAFPGGLPDGDVEELELRRPQKNDRTEAWREYAVARGMDDEQAAGMGRDELVAYYEADDPDDDPDEA